MSKNDQIFEVVITTVSAAGVPHIAPMGIRYVAPPGLGDAQPAPRGGAGSLGRPGASFAGGQVLLMPFKPSTTLDNVLATGHAVLNRLVDTRVFAGAVTGRRQWPLVPARHVAGQRLAQALSHVELELAEQRDDPQRPVLVMRTVHEATHAPFIGFNRAQAAVIEGAVLVSRLRMLPAEKIDSEMRYLQIAIDKTAGPEEQEAWGWLLDAVAKHRSAAA